MRVAVTGAGGFVGRYVLADLARRSMDVVATTRDLTKLAEWQDIIRIVDLNLARPKENDYDKLGRPDVLIHLAWDGLPNYRSLHHFETELPHQYRFLKGLIEAGLPALLVTGTCFEYGMRSGPLAEDMSTNPSNPYGYAKDALRRQLEFLRLTRPFALTWTRLFYMFGDGQASNSLYSQLKSAIARGDQSFNMSGGEQQRDYLPISEMARLIVDLALLRANAGPVNLCSGTPISVRELVERWLVDNSWNIKLNFGYYPYPDYEPMAFWGTRTYLGSLLKQL